MKAFNNLLILIVFLGFARIGMTQHVKLHVNPKWEECSFQLDSALTQKAWNQFAREAALVAYFRPLTDAKPMGVGNFEISILQWQTAIDDHDAAWNDTFVHHDSAHWLKEGNRLPIPGITVRAGITKKIDAAVYFTKSPGANYGFWGAQLQYNFLNNPEKNLTASTRLTVVSLYGPEDLNLSIIGADLVVSKEFTIRSNWAFIAPYAGVSTYLSNAKEKTEKVSLSDEHVVGVQGMIGAVAKLSIARLAVEYNLARVNTISLKIGVAF